MMTHMRFTSFETEETDRSLGSLAGQPSLFCKFQASERCCLKRGGQVLQGDTKTVLQPDTQESSRLACTVPALHGGQPFFLFLLS